MELTLEIAGGVALGLLIFVLVARYFVVIAKGVGSLAGVAVLGVLYMNMPVSPAQQHAAQVASAINAIKQPFELDHFFEHGANRDTLSDPAVRAALVKVCNDRGPAGGALGCPTDLMAALWDADLAAAKK